MCGAPPGAPESRIIIYVGGAGDDSLTFENTGSAAAFRDNAFEEIIFFDWQTGYGLLADHLAADAYKRAEGSCLAARIRSLRSGGAARISLVGFSAGAAVIVPALEELGRDERVEEVALLHPSIAADRDLTRAMQGICGKLAIFTSSRDRLLAHAIPLVGTAEGVFCGDCALGRLGPLSPHDEPDTLRAYERIDVVEWDARFEAFGNSGDHFDVLAPTFLREVVTSAFNSSTRCSQ